MQGWARRWQIFVEKAWKWGNRSCSVIRAKAGSNLNPWTNLKHPAVPTGTTSSKGCLFRWIGRNRSVLHSSLLYSSQSWFSFFLGEAIVTDFMFCKQEKGTQTWRCDSAHASKSPESCCSHPHLTFPRSRQHRSQLWHRRLTSLPVSSSKRTVSIKSK